MSAYIVLLLALVSRVLPLMFHSVGLNLTATGGGLLYFGARRPRWETIFAVAAMAVTDFYLTVFKYHLAFHVRGYLVTWAWYAVLCLMAHGLLKRVTVLRVVAGVLSSAIGFYIVSDFPVWAFGTIYPHTAAGLAQCYAAALPFLWNDLASTSVVAGLLFGVPALAARMQESAQGMDQSHV